MEGLGKAAGTVERLRRGISGIAGVNEVSSIEIPGKIKVQSRKAEDVLRLLTQGLTIANELERRSEK